MQIDESEGYVRLWRSTMRWEWKQDYKMVALWVDLLMRANHEPRRWKGVEVGRGQCVIGLLSLAKSTGISIKSVRRCLDGLKRAGQVAIKTTNRYSLLTIENWDNYQTGQEQGASERASEETSKGQTKGKQRATNNNINNKDHKTLKNNTKNINTSITLIEQAKPAKATRPALPELVWPEALSGDDCRAAFETWKAHRRGCGKPMSRQHEQATLDSWDDPVKFCAAIQNSVRFGWLKLVHPDDNLPAPSSSYVLGGGSGAARKTKHQQNLEFLAKQLGGDDDEEGIDIGVGCDFISLPKPI